MICTVKNFLTFKLDQEKNNDKTFGMECLDTLRPGDLCIRDLGYFSLERRPMQVSGGVPSGKCGFTTLSKFNVKKPDSNSYGIRLS